MSDMFLNFPACWLFIGQASDEIEARHQEIL
jgi:hypothetical protein